MSEHIPVPEPVSAEVPLAPNLEEPGVITERTAVANAVEAPAVNGQPAISVLPLVEDTTAPVIHPATKLRRMMEDPNGFVFAPGVHDGLSARVALEAGFETLYMVCPTL
jgi:hypothetical protein